MKRTALKRVGKRGRINLRANQKLKELYQDKPNRCELGFEGCTGSLYLGFAHRHQRHWYYQRPELLSSYEQTILVCTECHDKIERNDELTKQVFLRLRGVENV